MKTPSLETVALIIGFIFSTLVIGYGIRLIYNRMTSKDNKVTTKHNKKKDNNAVMGNANRARLLSNLRGLKQNKLKNMKH